MQQNQKGFGAVGVIAILAVLLVLGLAGWFVWNKNHDTASDNTNSATTPPQGEETAQKPASNPTEDWLTYSNTAGKFSFKYPKTWVFADQPEACTEGLVLFAASKEALGRCASESFGQMMVLSTAGDMRSNYALSEGYTDITETSIKVNKVEGVKRAAIAAGQEGLGMVPDGTRIIQYIFYTNNRTYVAEYMQQDSYPDAEADFDLLVQTLTFMP